MIMNNQLCMSGERIDDIGFGNLQLIQRPEEFCYGVDAVILAHYAASSCGNGHIVDLGTGTGIIPLLMSHMTASERIFGVEIQKDSYDRAVRNAKMNRLTERVSFIHGDVSDCSLLKEKIGQVSTVITNPPYMEGNSGLTNSNEAKRIARHETTAGLSEFLGTAAELLCDKGNFYMVHRPSRLVDICVECRKNKLEPKELRFVSPNRDSAPNILLIHCVKFGGRELRMQEPLYIYESTGKYTEEINKIYERK